MHIVIINTMNGQVETSRVFDTYHSSDSFDEFIKDDVPLGFIVIAAC